MCQIVKYFQIKMSQFKYIVFNMNRKWKYLRITEGFANFAK